LWPWLEIKCMRRQKNSTNKLDCRFNKEDIVLTMNKALFPF
jgi:hypothetical protein